jgi:hypothetical protein
VFSVSLYRGVISGKRDRLLEWRREIQSGLSLAWKVVVVWEIADNCYSWGLGTVREPRGSGISAIVSRYQMTGENTAD